MIPRERCHQILVLVTMMSVIALLTTGQFLCCRAKTVIDYVVQTSDIAFKAHKHLIEVFMEENPDILVKIRNASGSGDYWESLLVQMAGGVIPDVVYFDPKQLPGFVKNRAFLNITHFIERDINEIDLSDFFPPALEYFHYADGYYGLPADVTPIVPVINRDHFWETGLELPTAWSLDEFRNILRRLTTDADGDGLPERYGLQEMGWWVHSLPFLWSFEGNYYEVTSDRQSIVPCADQPATVKALVYLRDLKWQDEVMGGSFFAGAASIMLTSVDQHFMNHVRQLDDLKWDFAPIPTGPTGVAVTRFNSMTWLIPRQSRKHEEAWQFAKWLYSNKGQLLYGKLITTPARISAAREILLSEGKDTPQREEVFLDSMDCLRPHPANVLARDSEQIVGTWYGKLMRDEISPQEAAKQMQEQLSILLSEQ